MKSFRSPHSLNDCKLRFANLQNSSWLGFVQIKVKLIPMSDGNYSYVLWKTMRGNFRQEITLAEVNGNLIMQSNYTTVVSGISQMGRFYRVMFILYGLVAVFTLISYLTTQKISYLFFDGIFIAFMVFGWLLTYYWRNQLEGMIEQALLK